MDGYWKEMDAFTRDLFNSTFKTNPCMDDAVILEFKVRNKRKEASLEDTVQEALQQIEKKQYEERLIARGIPKEHIRSYGFAFQGKKVLIGE